MNTDAISAEGTRSQKPNWQSWFWRLRLEEFLAILSTIPIIVYTSKAYLFYRAQGHVPAVFLADIRLILSIVGIIAIGWIILIFKPHWEIIRSLLPFAYCLAFYTNLHDTIHFINPHDIHFALIKIDQWIFGVQPSIWTEQFVRPWLTEIFSTCYWSYFIVIPLVPFTLFFQRRLPEFRESLIATLLCLYVGYVLYIIFPAISPSVILKDMYSVPLTGTPITDATMGIANSLPSNVRDAFPSLHAAIALLSILFAWKYLRKLFWPLLPLCIGLVISTIYLRHHYFIDLPAGFLLAYLGYKYSGRIDSWWRTKQAIFKLAR